MRDGIEPDFEKRWWIGIKHADCEVWGNCYPAVDVDTELMRALEWLIANPTKLKKNYRKFILGWLSRAQERGGSKSNACHADSGEVLF